MPRTQTWVLAGMLAELAAADAAARTFVAVHLPTIGNALLCASPLQGAYFAVWCNGA
jgi:hypothetical protein